MLRNLTLLAAVLSMTLVASVPVLAQSGYGTQFAPIEGSNIVYVASNRAFNCGFLNCDPLTICIGDEDGSFTTPSGVQGSR